MKRNEAIELLNIYNDFLKNEGFLIEEWDPPVKEDFLKTDWAKENIPLELTANDIRDIEINMSLSLDELIKIKESTRKTIANIPDDILFGNQKKGDGGGIDEFSDMM